MSDTNATPADETPVETTPVDAAPAAPAVPAAPVDEPRGPATGWMTCEPADGPALANEAERGDALRATEEG